MLSMLPLLALLSADGAIQAVLYLVVVAVIFWVIWWFIAYVGVPEPFNKVLRVVVALAAVIIVINVLLGLVGHPIFRF